MKKVLLLVGGTVYDTPFLRKVFSEEYDRVIAGDAGLSCARRFGLLPDEAIGDFDSVKREDLAWYEALGRRKKVFPVRKDDTDSELVMKEAIKELEEGGMIFMAGGLCGRADHTISNVLLLLQPLSQGIPAFYTDGRNLVSLVEGPFRTEVPYEEGLVYFSLIPFEGPAKGITLKGFSYPLCDAALLPGHTLGVSNEVLETGGTFSLREGKLIVVRSCDALESVSPGGKD